VNDREDECPGEDVVVSRMAGDGVCEALRVGLPNGVGLGSRVTAVAVGLRVALGTEVGVQVAVILGAEVGVWVAVMLGIGVKVWVAVALGVAVGAQVAVTLGDRVDV